MTGGQAGDYPQAPGLLTPDLRHRQREPADRAYNADNARAQIAQAGAEAVIPSKRNRKQAVNHNPAICEHRNQMERCTNRFRAASGLATRFEKTAAAYLALVTLAAS